jgi:hypothetical protein
MEADDKKNPELLVVLNEHQESTSNVRIPNPHRIG